MKGIVGWWLRGMYRWYVCEPLWVMFRRYPIDLPAEVYDAYFGPYIPGERGYKPEIPIELIDFEIRKTPECTVEQEVDDARGKEARKEPLATHKTIAGSDYEVWG